ncbi:hypothetical protein DPEC_G00346790 [Dallia pectoralis]|uniref:Uncharacterized protein n=1 Tax=Dallia pectoralis TaxID=75939 RepID=A0ACC2F3U6_DALPE|nr:hypothetical protein DPEC_G00346790 [Dallia pectoralis]
MYHSDTSLSSRRRRQGEEGKWNWGCGDTAAADSWREDQEECQCDGPHPSTYSDPTQPAKRHRHYDSIPAMSSSQIP